MREIRLTVPQPPVAHKVCTIINASRASWACQRGRSAQTSMIWSKGVPSTSSVRRCAVWSNSVGTTSRTTPGPVAQRRRRSKAEPHLLFGAMPSSIDQPLTVGVDGSVLEGDPLRTGDSKEGRAAGDQRRELCAQRPDAEEGPVDGEQPARSQEEIAPECVMVAEDLG
jgi:hypothetical protein